MITNNNNHISEAIDRAEDIRDPLEQLVEKTFADSGAPFKPEVLERLAALKNDDRATFEALRTQLKNAGCRVTALDQEIAKESGDAGGRGPTQADTLIKVTTYLTNPRNQEHKSLEERIAAIEAWIEEFNRDSREFSSELGRMLERSPLRTSGVPSQYQCCDKSQ